MANSYELFVKIIEAKGITPYRVAKDTGLTTVLFTDWKKGKSKPKYDKLKIIADYLGVSTDYLSGVSDDAEPALTADEEWFILKLRSLDKEGRAIIEGTLMQEVRRVEKEKEAALKEGVTA